MLPVIGNYHIIGTVSLEFRARLAVAAQCPRSYALQIDSASACFATSTKKLAENSPVNQT